MSNVTLCASISNWQQRLLLQHRSLYFYSHFRESTALKFSHFHPVVSLRLLWHASPTFPLYEKPHYLPHGHCMCAGMCCGSFRPFSHAVSAVQGISVIQPWPCGGTVASLYCYWGLLACRTVLPSLWWDNDIANPANWIVSSLLVCLLLLFIRVPQVAVKGHNVVM